MNTRRILINSQWGRGRGLTESKLLEKTDATNADIDTSTDDLSIDITPAKRKQFMTLKELKLKKMLKELLKDDGHGHYHELYAKRLADFDIHIVTLDEDPSLTACVSFDEGIIMISEGFLIDKYTIHQLPTLIRHEMAHSLLMHQVRMAHELGDLRFVKLDGALSRLWNVIDDDEISNRKYNEYDKKIVRNMVLNGQVIGGLVTEDHRDAWKNMSIEQMYHEVLKEIDAMNKKIQQSWESLGVYSQSTDFIEREIAKLYIYTDTKSPSAFKKPIDYLLTKSKRFKQYSQYLQDAVKNTYDVFNDADESTIDAAMKVIATSSPTEIVKISNSAKKLSVADIVSPAEKWFVMQTLKRCKGLFDDSRQKIAVRKTTHSQEYKDFYNQIIKHYDNDTYDTSSLYKILNKLSGKGDN